MEERIPNGTIVYFLTDSDCAPNVYEKCYGKILEQHRGTRILETEGGLEYVTTEHMYLIQVIDHNNNDIWDVKVGDLFSLIESEFTIVK